MATEIVGLRTRNSKTFDLGGGKRRLEVGGHYHHFKNGEWVESDRTLYTVGNKVITGEFPFPIDFDLSTRTATIDFGTTQVTVSPTLGVRSPTVTTSPDEILLAGLWRSVDVRVHVVKNIGLKFTYTKTASNAPTQIAWQLGGDYQNFIGAVGYDDQTTGEWVTVPSTLVNGLLTIDISGVPVGQEIDPTFSVASSGDDWYLNTTSSFYGTGTYVAFGASSSYSYNAGIIFSNVTIPQGATITTAYAQGYSALTYGSLPCTIDCAFLAADTAATAPTNYSGASSYFSSKTSAVTWDFSGGYSVGTLYSCPSLVTPLQEIVDRSGWSSGNSVALSLLSTGAVGSQRYRAWASYDNTTYTEPQLIVEYDTGGATTNSDTVGGASTLLETRTGTVSGSSSLLQTLSSDVSGASTLAETLQSTINGASSLKQVRSDTISGSSTLLKVNNSTVDGASTLQETRSATVSGASTLVSGVPADPSNATATAYASYVEVAWTDNSDNETAFVIERRWK